MKATKRLRDLPGVVLRDLARYGRALEHSGLGHRSDAAGWISLCNRGEAIHLDTRSPGAVCGWQWGSALHAPEVLPSLGRRMLDAALDEWPIRFAASPAVVSGAPRVSFVIAHGGVERLPQLRRTIQSIYAQEQVACECIVVDQSPAPILGQLPSPLVYRHLAKDGVPAGWYKAWAFNVGAKLARGSVIVFHDGDVCAPSAYASELLKAIEERGFASASLQRLLFYLSESDTRAAIHGNLFPTGLTPNLVFQNWKGGTIAVARDAFLSLGGFDEGFVDWGGEDDEFFDRCQSLRHCRAGYLPFVHLWHAPQPDRYHSKNANIHDIMPRRLAISRESRVAEFAGRHWGNPDAPDPMHGYKADRRPA